MLAEERYAKILEIVEKNGGATAQELMTALDASESTIRRDLNTMDAKGLLTKVHGGAMPLKSSIHTVDEAVENRKALNRDEKAKIAKFAASLIGPKDFVYLDAGTTTDLMIDYIETKEAIFVTNAISHAKKLSDKGIRVYILGGEFKSATEAIVGEEAVVNIEKYNFTIGFWGTNGIDMTCGYTTPEIKEALLKKKGMENCKKRYILADSSKFSEISSIKFGDINSATIITTQVSVPGFEACDNIIEVQMEVVSE